MASAIPNETHRRALQYILTNEDIYGRLVMSDTTCDTEVDGINNLSNYSTIDPCDSTGYADLQLSSELVTADDANDRGEYDAADLVFSGLGGDAARTIVGCLLYNRVDGTNANDQPLWYIEFTTPLPTASTQVTVPWDAEGIIQLQTAP